MLVRMVQMPYQDRPRTDRPATSHLGYETNIVVSSSPNIGASISYDQGG